MSRKYSLNMSCGQTDLYPAALAAMSKQLHTPIYFKPYFDLEVAMMGKLKRALFTKNDVVVMPGTATYGEEAAMQSLLEPGDEVLTVNTGAFGRVLKNLADIVGANVTELLLPRGSSVSVEQVREALAQHPKTKMVGVVHVETSQGTCNPVDQIGKMLQEEYPDVLYLVDSVSGFAAVPLYVDEWGIDVCCTSTQKAVNAPQGVAIVTVSDKAWDIIDKRRSPVSSLVLDLWVWRGFHKGNVWASETWDELDPPEIPEGYMPEVKRVVAHGPTLAYVMAKALDAALDEILEEGIESIWKRTETAGRALRAGLRAMGLEILADEENAAPDATCVTVSRERTFEVRRFMHMMYDDYGICCAGGAADLGTDNLWCGYNGFRVGTMGQVACADAVLPFLSAVERALPRLGYDIRTGVALAAAQAVFTEVE